ncbi:MAG: DUF2779 domain-containing protein [Anaerolineales bacterium]
MITKTDFLEFIDAPMHFWASKHDQIEKPPPLYDQHLMRQGKEVERLAREFIETQLLEGTKSEIIHEKTFVAGNFQARVDTLARDPAEGVIDIYEIKSSTSVKKEDQYDVAFQRLVCEVNVNVRDVFIVHLDPDYTRQGGLDLASMFTVVNMNKEIQERAREVAAKREEAWRVASLPFPEGIQTCTKPQDCPCPSLCHGGLPEYPIYDIPRLYSTKAKELKSRGILSIHDIPDGYPLSSRQDRQVEAVKSGDPFIDTPAIVDELSKLQYPLSFLDYETYSPAVPLYDGYKPYQHIVFQYSLHIVESPESKLEHIELLLMGEGDPGMKLAEHLSKHAPDSGSVIVWNKPFEVGRNRAMAERYLAHRDVLLNLNSRMYDLMKIFSRGLYIHPDFHGSASIKNVLPVLVPEFGQNYTELNISSGDEAMLAWADLVSGQVPDEQVQHLRNDLLAYCKLDTLAMVKIWETLREEVM